MTELCRTAGIEAEAAYWAGMALREALANAIKHGNKLNPEKRVHLHILFQPGDGLRITVEDEGEGFDATQLADPTDPQNLLRSSGRGVFYMRHFMDSIAFSPSEHGGTRIELVKSVATGRTP